MNHEFVVLREPTQHPTTGEAFTLGRVYYNGVLFAQSCEDADRRLESGEEEKVYGCTAIPRGRYRLVVSHSHRFGKVLPELLDVPGFSGVRVHGGNRAEDSHGCILMGKVRTATGIAQCADTVQRIIRVVETAEEVGEHAWLEVR